MDDDIRKEMINSYHDGGVSALQVRELGGKRPSIEIFLNFSDQFEGAPFRAISEFGGLEFVFDYAKHFEGIGISGRDLALCVDGDTDAIRSVCREILKSMDSAKHHRQRGETHLVSRGIVINSTAVKAFILAALDARERYQEPEIVPELYFLLAQVLFPGEPDVEKARQSGGLRYSASLLGWAYHDKHGHYPSYRKLATLLNVAPSTISRLFEGQEDFEKSASWHAVLGYEASKHPSLSNIYPHL